MADSRQYMALEWVIRDIKDTLVQAENALDAYIRDSADIIQLKFCLTYIHQVYGGLHMSGFHGAAMIASEMEALAKNLLESNVSHKSEAIEVLMHAIQRMPNYLEDTLHEKRDQPSQVFSLLNDLRAVRDAHFLSESTAFAPDLTYAHSISGSPQPIIKNSQQFQLVMSKLRKMYQYAAASVIHKNDVEKNLSYLLKVSQRLEQILGGTKRFALWEVVSAFVDGLQAEVITPNASIKKLLRALDDELKTFVNDGVKTLSVFTNDDLLKNLLYYLFSADGSTTKIDHIRECYHLDSQSLLTQTTSINNSSSPVNISAMQAVTSAIKEELFTVKESLNECQAEYELTCDLDQMAGAFQRVADTLAILSVENLRQEMLTNIERVAELRTYGDSFPSNELLVIEQSIHTTELALEHALLETQSSAQSASHQFTEEQEVALQESRNGLEESKDSVVNYIATQWNINNLKPVPLLLRNVSQNLSLLDLAAPAEILSACASYIELQLINQSAQPKWEQLDSLADVIASIDYFLEVLSLTKEEDVAILKSAQQGLLDLGVPVTRVRGIMDGLPSDPNEAIIEPQVTEAAIEDAASDEDEAFITDDIIEIFVEEAEEVQETIAEYFPQWVENNKNEQALIEIRRAFHTLKGSGRLVKAMDIGELSWSVENMLNRVLDRTLVPQPAHMSLIEKVRLLLPELVDAYSQQKATPKKALCEQYMAWADELSKGNIPENWVDENETNDVSESIVQEAESEDIVEHDIDAQLWEIFSGEAESHLDVVKSYIAEMDAASPCYTPPSDLMQRAMHTLKGSAYMADITPIAELMKPMELFAKDLRGYQVDIDADILQLIKDSVSYTEEALAQIADLTYPQIEKLDLFLARVAELRERSVGHLIRHEEEEVQAKVDPAVLEMLMNESMDQLLDADLLIEQWRVNGATTDDWQPVADELAGVVHGAERANLDGMIQLSQALLGVYQSLISHGSGFKPTDDLYETLLNGHLGLLDIIDAIAAGQDVPKKDKNLLSQLRALVDNVVPSNDIEDSVSIGLQETVAEPEPVINTYDLSPLAPEFVESNTESVEEVTIDSTRSDEVVDTKTTPDVIAEELEVEPEKESSADSEAASNVTGSFAPVPVFDAGVYDETDDEVDEEIIEIFLEEAAELIDELDEVIHAWESGGDARENNEAIQRLLHTFKGGARLAGLMPLGDLAHDFESYLISQPSSNTSDSLLLTIHQYQDKLIENVNALSFSTDLPEQTESAVVLPANDNVELDTALDVDVVTEVTEKNNAVDSTIDEFFGDELSPFSSSPIDITNDSLEPPVLDHLEVDTSLPSVVEINNEGSGDANVVPFAAKAELEPIVPPISNPAINFNADAANVATARRAAPQEMVKVSAGLMEELVNLAGETSISRGRMEQQMNDLGYSLDEMDSTVERLQEQLRRLDIETEAQVIFRQEQLADREDFDPLEMDRYSQLQQLSRSLIESASDLIDLKATLANKARDAETVLVQQSRINTELQEGLMRSRMVPFSRLVPRLRRIVRQISNELGKDVTFESSNAEGELDRNMMERMVAPLEHMLRNSVDHGIEPVDVRQQRGKPSVGNIILSLSREGGNVLLALTDDGGGIKVDQIRKKAIEQRLMSEDADLNDEEVLQFIFRPGFSTAEEVTQISGRGVGMDVVSREIKQLGGSISIHSKEEQGTTFAIRLPFTLSVNRALMITMGDDGYAIPLNVIQGIARISPDDLAGYYDDPDSRFEYAGTRYQLRYLGSLLDKNAKPRLEGHTMPVPVLLVRSADHAVALHVDSLQGSREIVVKSLGAQFSSVEGLSGATILGDGHVVVILDVHAMIRQQYAKSNLIDISASEPIVKELPARNTLIMVVDDSVTVRKVATRFLEREGFDVITAKDGVHALEVLQDHRPDVMLLDIEMPRMDGFEVAKRVRSSTHVSSLPIIMITSRTGEKHRQTGLAAGANFYMGKPYQEDKLLENIRHSLQTTEQPI